MRRCAILYAAGLPLGPSANLGPLDHAPPSLGRLYREAHDGYVFLPARSLGPLPSKSLFTLGDMEWGWLEDSNNPKAYDPPDKK